MNIKILYYYCGIISNSKPLQTMQNAKTKISEQQAKKKSTVKNTSLGEKLYERASAYSEKTGIKITALLRNGLDMLLKQNNY